MIILLGISRLNWDVRPWLHKSEPLARLSSDQSREPTSIGPPCNSANQWRNLHAYYIEIRPMTLVLF